MLTAKCARDDDKLEGEKANDDNHQPLAPKYLFCRGQAMSEATQWETLSTFAGGSKNDQVVIQFAI